jgi:hypothetical protein
MLNYIRYMSEGTFSPESLSARPLHEEFEKFCDGITARKVTGDRGSRFDLNEGNQSIAWNQTQDAIVTTKSGNDYYITHDREGGIYIVNTRETEDTGKLVAAHNPQYGSRLPAIEFGLSWNIPGCFSTSDVESLRLRYKVVPRGSLSAGEQQRPDPFERYKSLLRKHVNNLP